jgi:hypothetical protein
MSPRTRAVAALAASLALVAVAAAAWATMRTSGVGDDLARQTDAAGATAALSPAPTPSPTPAMPLVDGPLVDATQIPVAVERPAPTRLDIPSAGISMPVQATGVAPDGQMELPADPRVIGWYRFGPLPGDPAGSAALGGHVDSVEVGTGPLAALAGVQVGAEVVVTAADNTPLRYQVTAVQRIQKAALPTDLVFAPTGPAQLAIVTCGGRYLPDAGGYEDNVVVIAMPSPGGTP